MIPAPFDYHRPGTLDEAIGLLSHYGSDAKVLSGGMSLLPALKLRLGSYGHLVDIGRIDADKEAGLILQLAPSRGAPEEFYDADLARFRAGAGGRANQPAHAGAAACVLNSSKACTASAAYMSDGPPPMYTATASASINCSRGVPSAASRFA